MGRKPIGKAAMTAAERQRRRRGQQMEIPRGRLADLMRRDAEEYLQAATILKAHGLKEALRPTYGNLCHAIELSLKAFLTAKDVDDRALFNLRHDLRRAYRTAVAAGLNDPTARVGELVDALAPFHEGLAFRYRQLEFDHVPEFEDAMRRAEELIEAIKPQVRSTLLRDLHKPYEYEYLTNKPESRKSPR